MPNIINENERLSVKKTYKIREDQQDGIERLKDRLKNAGLKVSENQVVVRCLDYCIDADSEGFDVLGINAEL